ncbi:protein ECERIFERUM 2 [Cornus florida]|uniref:protein ECERIFERUM 2 n=1 Tax=Cornus florida TaxID=4283 RepID=UPI00289CD9BA|nr:protein ECERIFERUM 2 [Cornus florida]
MASTHIENTVSDILLSSVVPGRVTGEDKVHELTNMDLAMKLHYIKGLYFFKSEAMDGTDIFKLKEAMFPWLVLYSPISGRIRLPEKGRPFIKCNDGGVRIVEAKCSRTLEEWLGMKDRCLDDQLVYNHALGPDLNFSPLVFIQLTWFKCGGLSVGLSWAHILGDILSASDFINMWGQILAGNSPTQSLDMPNDGKPQFPSPLAKKPFSVEKVDPVGDYWLSASNCKMETHSFHVTPKQLNHVFVKACGLNQVAKAPHFELLSALMWKSFAKVGGNSVPRIVTICNNNSHRRENENPSNGQVISIVRADFYIEDANLSELMKLIDEERMDEGKMIEELVEMENGKSDFLVYGANLTFVNLEEANMYGLKMNGHAPVFVNYTISGVGNKGVVLVLPGPKNLETGCQEGRTITVILPENQMLELKNELREEWSII